MRSFTVRCIQTFLLFSTIEHLLPLFLTMLKDEVKRLQYMLKGFSKWEFRVSI
jgi:hypothetical protein